MEWCRGVDALAAAELVRGRDPVDKRELKAILLAIVEAYAQLHEQLVVHGDVHPRNLLIGSSDGRRSSISARPAHKRATGERSARPWRGRSYMEPELARARLDGGKAQPPTPAGEQYSIAALLYFLLSGVHTHDFVLEEGQMLRQVIGDPPRPLPSGDFWASARGARAAEGAGETPRSTLRLRPGIRDALQQALDRTVMYSPLSAASS